MNAALTDIDHPVAAFLRNLLQREPTSDELAGLRAAADCNRIVLHWTHGNGLLGSEPCDDEADAAQRRTQYERDGCQVQIEYLPALRWFYWDTDIGEMVARASSVDEARAQVLKRITRDDAMYNDVVEAIAGEPEVCGSEPLGVIAWHQG